MQYTENHHEQDNNTALGGGGPNFNIFTAIPSVLTTKTFPNRLFALTLQSLQPLQRPTSSSPETPFPYLVKDRTSIRKYTKYITVSFVWQIPYSP